MSRLVQGASTKELLIEACRRNNTDLLTEIIEGCAGGDDEVARLLNETTTVMGNHLYHEAASQGNCASPSPHPPPPPQPPSSRLVLPPSLVPDIYTTGPLPRIIPTPSQRNWPTDRLTD